MRPIHNEDRNSDYEAFFRSRGVYDHPDLAGHIPRYLHTLRHMPFGPFLRNGSYAAALELGTTYLFPQIMLDSMGFKRVDVTDFSLATDDGTIEIPLPFDPKKRKIRAFNVDLEKTPIPCADEEYDLVICFEVIEHMEIDPMHLMSEINRVLAPGGLAYITTPNSTSARNVFKILRGFAPHFFMKYSKGRTYHRHNIEYAPHQLVDLVKSAGFSIRKLWTEDTFEDSLDEAMDFLRKNDFPTSLRGDNMFLIAEKSGPVVNRFPESIYF